MEPGSIRQALIFLFCLLCSAFFSASEASLLSISDVRARAMAENGERGAKAILRATRDRSKLLGTVLFGNNLANTAATSIATAFAIHIAGNDGLALVVATAIVTICILLLCEMIPKSIATHNPPVVAGLLSGAVNTVQVLLWPATRVLNAAADGLLRLFGVRDGERPALVTEAELKTMMAVSREEGVIKHDEYQMIRNIFEFDESRARDVMTPRTEMAAIPETAAYDDVYRVFREEGFSRLPVYRDDVDHITGILHFKDFVFSAAPDGFDLPALLRRPTFSYENKLTSELFMEMRQSRAFLAVILDEYGGTSGIVTLEDLIEEIMGDITDEYDDEAAAIEPLGGRAWRVDGAARLDDINETLGLSITSDDYETIGGYVMGLLGTVPEPETQIADNKLAFTVEAVDKNRVATLRIEEREEEQDLGGQRTLGALPPIPPQGDQSP